MRYLQIFLFLLFAVITAEAERVLPEIKSEYYGEEYNFTEEEPGGDSWYDGGQQVVVSASSVLPASGKNSYNAANAHDSKMDTAWVEGKQDYGIGESVTFTFDGKSLEHDRFTINGFSIANGYVKSKKLWGENTRIKTLKIYVDGKELALAQLRDVYGLQVIKFKEIKLLRKNKVSIKLEIVEVYPGSKFADTSISEVIFFGTGIY